MQTALTPALAQAVERMPAFPHSVQRVLTMTRDMQCAPKDLVHVIESDPVMVAKVLRVVNSAQFGLQKKIQSIAQAVVFLGINTIKNIALGVAAIGVLPAVSVGRFDSSRFLRHSLACAAASRVLAGACAQVDPMEAFIAGLLHDLGKVILAQHMAREFTLAVEYAQWHGTSLHVAFQQTLGIDHASIGAALLERWQFASATVQAVRLQAQPTDCAQTVLASCVFVANQTCKRQGFDDGASVQVEPLPDAVLQRLRLTSALVEGLIGDTRTLLEQVQSFATP